MDANTISAIANCITALGTLGAVGVASYGLTLWKQQLVGKDEYELAKHLLTLVYKMRLWVGRYRAALVAEFGPYTKEAAAKELSELWPEFESSLSIASAFWGDAFRRRHFTSMAGFFMSPFYEKLSDCGDFEMTEQINMAVDRLIADLAPHMRKTTELN